jgi:hypothetical protein
MKLPGFNAEASLHDTKGRYHFAAARRSGAVTREITSQLKGSVFHRPGIGGLFTIEDYWTCKQDCDTARSQCLSTCEGTWYNPKPSSNCLFCDQDYNACMQGCSRDIA